MHARLDTHLMKLFKSEIGDILLNLEHQTKWVGNTFPYGEPLDEPYARNSLLRIQLEFSSPNPDLKTVGSLVLKKQQTIPDVKGLWYYIYTCAEGKETTELFEVLCAT